MTSPHAHSRPRRRDGFTLIELMVVVAIVAILAAIAYPSYRDYVRRSNRAVGQALMAEIGARQERYFSNNNTYAEDLTLLGFGANPYVDDKRLYSVSVELGAFEGVDDCDALTACYVVVAKPVSDGPQADDQRCATMWLHSNGGKAAANKDGQLDTEAVCWK